MRTLQISTFSTLVLLLTLSACETRVESLTLQGEMAGPYLARHEYDPISDAVVSWRLEPEHSVGQSFRIGTDNETLAGFRVKLLRVGEVPALHFRIERRDGDEVCSGEISRDLVGRFFERWCGVDFKQPIQLDQGGYVLWLDTGSEPVDGHYELFGTSLERIDAPEMASHYQYLPAWGDGPVIRNLENPMNTDLGASTPLYEDGVALIEDRALPALDFAFQMGTQPGVRGDEVEERFSFIEDELLAPIHSQSGPLQEAEASEGKVQITSSWGLAYPTGSGLVIQTAARDFLRFMEMEMGVPITAQEIRAENGVPSQEATILIGTQVQLGQTGKRLRRSESFDVEITGTGVTLVGYDERGVMRGLQYLEDLMSLRRAAILELKTEVREPLYSPRMTTAPFYAQAVLDYPDNPYTDDFLARISHAGFDGIWLWGDLFDVGRSDLFPELDNQVARRQARLREISEKAQAWGVDVYVVLAYRPLPASFFEKHLELRGSPFKAYGGDYVLCTSTDSVQAYLRESTEDLFRSVPLLRGVVFIVGGEGFIHCHTRRLDCPRCSTLGAQKVIARLATDIESGVRVARPDAHVALWPYSASNHWSKGDITQSKLIEILPKGITFMTEFGKEGLVRFGKTTIPAYDYPISYLGPSERFVEQAKLAAERGLPFWVKGEHAIALEMIQTPYLPIFFRWAERFRRIAEYDYVSGAMLNWMHYGFTPSIAAEVAKWHTWSPLPESEDLLRRIARREFGAAAEDAVLEAWRHWSEAIAHYPFSGPMAMGPIQKGPAHPLFWDPEYEPFHHYGRQFKNDLNWTEPWGPEVALTQLEKLEAGWDEGVKAWTSVEATAPPELRDNAVREGGVARALLACIRSAVNVGRFFQMRERFHREKDAGRRAQALQTLKEIAQHELENARAAVVHVARDSRLGYVNSGMGETIGAARGGLYSPGSIQKKIRHLERLLSEEIPAAEAEVSGTRN